MCLDVRAGRARSGISRRGKGAPAGEGVVIDIIIAVAVVVTPGGAGEGGACGPFVPR